MAITKINNVLVKHGKIMFGVITAIIIVAFVWFFTPGADGSILFGTNPNSPDAVYGDVAGTPVTKKDVTDVIKAATLFQAVQLGKSPDETRINVQFEEAFPMAAMYKAAQRFGVVITDDQVAKTLRILPVFMKDGKFNAEAYIAYEKNQLQPAGFNAKDLEEAVRMMLTFNALPQYLDNKVLSPSEAEEALKNDLTTTEALKIVFKTDDFKKTVKPSAKDLQTFYNNNKGQFLSQETYKGETVVFRYNDYKVSEKAAKDFYNRNKATLINPADGKQMTYDQFKTDYIKNQQKQLALADAKAFREKVYKATELIAGDRKAYLNEYQKLASAIPGKRLVIGWFSGLDKVLPGIGEEAALKTALVMKSRENAPVTDPVVGEKGVYVAAVSDVKAPAQLDFAAAKADVQKKYIEQTATLKAREALRNFRAALEGAKKAKQAIDEKKIRTLAKGGVVEKVPAIKLFATKESVLKISKELEALSKTKLSAQEMNMKMMQGQMQMQFAMMQLQQYMPILETATGALSKDSVSAEGNMVYYVAKRTVPTAKELAAKKGTFDALYSNEKQQTGIAAFYEWLGKNTRNHLLQQQAQQELPQK